MPPPKKPNPRYDILSLRVTKEEWDEIWWTSQAEKKSISDLCRERIFSVKMDTREAA